MAGIMLWNKIQQDKKKGNSFWNFGEYNFLVGCISALLLVILLFATWYPEPHFSNNEEQIDYGKRTNQPWLVTDALWEKAKSNPDSLDYHYQLLKYYFSQETNDPEPPDLRKWNRQGVEIFNFYTDLSEEKENTAHNDIGYLFLAQWYIDHQGHDPSNAGFCLRQIQNANRKYVAYFSGKVTQYEAGGFAAIPDYEEELKRNGFKQGAWEQLSKIYDASGNDPALEKLMSDTESKAAVPHWIQNKFYFFKGDIFSFYQLHLSDIFSTVPVWGIIGALLILIVWVFFLHQINFITPLSWKHFLLAVSIGIILCMSSLLLYEFYHEVLGFSTNGEPLNDFLYCFLGIGFIEELVKLIPLLIILRFTKIIQKPIHYLLIASAASLGFAFFENLIYISRYGLDVLHARALTAVVSHMASGAIAAYGFILVRYRYPKQIWIIPLAFLAAALAHGFYDFWLVNDKVRGFSILTFLFYLIEILVYVSFLNNALNQSVDRELKNEQRKLNTQSLAGFIAGSLVFIFIVEYMGIAFTYGTGFANKSLNSSVLTGGYLVFFLSVRLSNITIRPNEWVPIEFFTGLFPSELMMRSRRKKGTLEENVYVQISPVDHLNLLHRLLPMRGELMREIDLPDGTTLLEFEPDYPVMKEDEEIDLLYLKKEVRMEELGE
jgi:RsiW-degrading membrane proteinase PrsW (M82 family)